MHMFLYYAAENEYIQEWYQNEIAYIMNLFDCWLACLHACFYLLLLLLLLLFFVVVDHLFSSC